MHGILLALVFVTRLAPIEVGTYACTKNMPLSPDPSSQSQGIAPENKSKGKLGSGPKISPQNPANRQFNVTEDKTGTNHGKYIVPNEGSPYLFTASLKGAGTLIAVGTFRGLLDASIGNFSRVVLFDYDGTTTLFNKLNIEILSKIGESKSLSTDEKRYQYLSFLSGTWLDSGRLNELRRLENEAKRIEALFKILGPEDYHETISTEDRSPYLNREAFPKEFHDLVGRYESFQRRRVRAVKYTHENTNREHDFTGWLRTYHSNSIDFAEWRLKLIYNISNYSFNSGKGETLYYWEDDRIWNKIQKLISLNRLNAMTGNLVGKTGMKSLTEFLRQGGEHVSVVDVSNAEEYFEDDSAAKRQYLLNVNELPKSEDLVLLRTLTDKDGGVSQGPDREYDGDWYYQASVFKTPK